jgi:hypothetical protein
MSTTMTRAGALSSLVGCACVLVATSVSAGERAPASSLPTMPAPHDRSADPDKPLGVTGLKVTMTVRAGDAGRPEVEAATSRGYCLASREYGLRLERSSTWDEHDQELWRLGETDGKATLERTRFAVMLPEKDASVKSQVTIPLREVARANGVVVWAYREANGDVVVLTRGGDRGREPIEAKKNDGVDSFNAVSSECAFGATRIPSSSSRLGGVAQLHGRLKAVGEGKEKVVPQFVVDASLSHVKRDGEPFLAVRIRLLE